MLVELELLLKSILFKLHLQVYRYSLYVLVFKTRNRQPETFFLQVMQSDAALIIHEFDRKILFKYSNG